MSEAPEQWFECKECHGSCVKVFGRWGYAGGVLPQMIRCEEWCVACHGDGGWVGEAEND